MATIDVKDAAGSTVAIEKPLAPGRAAAVASRPVALSNEDAAFLDGLETAVASTNTKLDTLAGHVDTLETLIASTNTKLDTAITALQIIDNMVLAAGSANIGDVDVLTLPTDPVGANADAASATGSISAKLRAIATALGVTALDLGQGTGGSRTIRVAVDSAQLDGTKYEKVAESQTAQVLGATGATGDYISHVIITPQDTTVGEVTLLDNAISIPLMAAGTLSNTAPIQLQLGMLSVSGAWKITTGVDVDVLAVGNFT